MPTKRQIAPDGGCNAKTKVGRPCAAPAVERLLVSPTTAPLAVAYETLSGSPNIPAEVVITMRP